jgi:hypothetical protein
MARVRFIFPLVVSLLAGNERAHGQSESSNVHVLPRIVVVTRTAPRAKPSRAQNAPRVIRPAPTPVAYPRTPIAGSGIDIDKVPASVNTVDVNQIERVSGGETETADLTIYRIVQVAVTNVCRHAIATSIIVTIEPAEQFPGMRGGRRLWCGCVTMAADLGRITNLASA